MRILLLLVSFPALAGALVAPPDCWNEKGEKVHFEGLPHNLFAAQGDQVARSFTNYNNEPTTDYDQDLLASTPSQFQSQVLYHECAHHELGHVDHYAQMTSEERARMELEADCRSVRRLRDERGYRAEDLAVILEYAAKTLTGVGASPEQISVRLSNLKSCFDSENR